MSSSRWAPLLRPRGLNPKTFAKNATIIQIDIDASELGKNVDVDLAIVGDAAYVLNAMLPMIEDKKHPTG